MRFRQKTGKGKDIMFYNGSLKKFRHFLTFLKEAEHLKYAFYLF